ncbi:hypothetical protein ACFC1T_08690 [Kitasatospora sp. NPDC056076]|uniref:hypothetical protein n=1 Tax=Kitasatospora sp. NPDC056076 TaxID=3345703 RepID=UPI0035DF6C61
MVTPAMPCGCAQTCQCGMSSGVGTAVSGVGTQTLPFKVGLDLYDPNPAVSACNQWISCLTANLGPSLYWDPIASKIKVKISRDAGNTLSIDNTGLLSTGGGSACRRTVASLQPDTSPYGGLNHIVFGDRGVGINTFPQQLMRGIRASVDLAMQAVYLVVDGLVDGTPVLFPCGRIQDTCTGGGYYTVYSAAKMDFSDMDISPTSNMYINAYIWYRSFHNWGWYGAGEAGLPNTGPMGGNAVGIDQIGFDTVSQVLNEVGHQLVFAFLLSTRTTGRPEVGNALVSTIIQNCAQQASIVIAYDPQDTVVASQNGIQTGIQVAGTDPLLAHTPQQLKDFGISWIFADKTTSDTALAPYKQAGFNIVLTGGIARRAFQARGNQYRGVVCVDSSYYLGRVASPHAYDLWAFGNYTSGQLHTVAEDNPFNAVARGSAFIDFGYDPCVKPLTTAQFVGWTPDTQFEPSLTTGANLITTVLGWGCPLPQPTSYSIAWSHRFNQMPRTLDPQQNGLGMLIALADDSDVRDGAVPANYYWLHQTGAGELVVTRRANNTDTTFSGGTTGNAAANTWYHFRVTVSPTQVLLERFNKPATSRNFRAPQPPVLQQSVTVTAGEPGPRGAYVAIHKHQDGAGDRFGGSWANYEYLSI